MTVAPLEGIRVVSFGTGAVIPEWGKTLGEFGADVIKIESKENPDFAVAFDGAVSYQIISVTVSYAYAESLIIRQRAVLSNTVGHGPTEEEAKAVAARFTVSKDGSLRPAAGMEAKTGIV